MSALFSPAQCKRLIVKIGSALLVDPQREVRRAWLKGVVADIAERPGVHAPIGAVVTRVAATATSHQRRDN